MQCCGLQLIPRSKTRSIAGAEKYGAGQFWNGKSLVRGSILVRSIQSKSRLYTRLLHFRDRTETGTQGLLPLSTSYSSLFLRRLTLDVLAPRVSGEAGRSGLVSAFALAHGLGSPFRFECRPA